MKTITILLILLLGTQLLHSQVVESSCEAPDSITDNYEIGAGILTLRKFYEYDIPYKDSIIIPTTHVDTFLNAMLAVWNATELPARDTVVDMLNISAAFNYDVRAFNIKCDSSAVWAENVINGIQPSGNDTIDSLMNKYQLEYFLHLNSVEFYYIYLKSNVNYNMPQLLTLFESIPDVISGFANSGQYAGYVSKDIKAEIFPEYVDLEYSWGWGDCPSGCFYWRYWDFRVYYDCSVEYLGSHGYPLPQADITEINSQHSIQIYPNPVSDCINIVGFD